jgi:hypothetical protein
MAQKPPPAFDWKNATFRWNTTLSDAYAQEWGLTPLVFEWLQKRGDIGHCLCAKYGERCLAVPFRDADGNVFRAQCRAPKRDQNGHASWAYEPAKDPLKRSIPAWIVGEHITAREFLFESHHDLIAFVDKGEFMSDVDDGLVTFISTCSADGTRRLETIGGWAQNVEIFLVPQNDEEGQEWLAKVLRILAPHDPRILAVPPPYKDFGEWAPGLTRDQLYDLIEAAPQGTTPPGPEGKNGTSQAGKGKNAPCLIEVLTPSEIKAYQPPPGTLLVGDNHIVRGSAFVIGGAPGTGKSRATVALSEAGATGYEWFGQPVHCKFRTIIIQNENGRYRLQQEFADLDEALLDQWVRISPPPPYGLCFHKQEFRDQLKRIFDTFPPGVVILDPWNAISRDDKQKDYLEAFELVQETTPNGDQAPALGIIAHTRKPRPDERANKGRALLNLLSGSYVLGSIPRTVWILQNASDLVTDNRVAVTCCKNNNGRLGDRTAWERDNGLWTPVTGFDWDAFDNPAPPSKKGAVISEQAMGSVFDHGYKQLKLAEAVSMLMTLTGLKKTVCYAAFDLSKGPFKDRLIHNLKTRLYSWNPA